MKEKQYDILTFIGRYEPWHYGHQHVYDAACALGKKILILVGSSEASRSVRNPWDYEKRKMMITESILQSEHGIEKMKNTVIAPLSDITYNLSLWIEQVQSIVKEHTPNTANTPRIGIIGHSKDASSYYLQCFPMWESVEVPSYEDISGKPVSATHIREAYFQDGDAFYAGNTSPAVTSALVKFSKTTEFKRLQDEFNFTKAYKKSWESAPYPPTFVTVDAVVVQAGHVLLIRRKAAPGMGLWALPGGFIGQDETLKSAMLRELREETRIKVPSPVLEGSITHQRVFDDPYRSTRGRTVTHAFLIELRNVGKNLPRVKGSDDADKAKWVPLSEIKECDLYEDHYHIIREMIGYK